jgi:hypothetical protein
LPNGVSPGQSVVAIRSSTITTRSTPAMSWSVNARPVTIGMPIVSKCASSPRVDRVDEALTGRHRAASI